MLPYSLPALGLLETCEATTEQGRVDWLTRSPSVLCAWRRATPQLWCCCFLGPRFGLVGPGSPMGLDWPALGSQESPPLPLLPGSGQVQTGSGVRGLWGPRLAELSRDSCRSPGSILGGEGSQAPGHSTLCLQPLVHWLASGSEGAPLWPPWAGPETHGASGSTAVG